MLRLLLSREKFTGGLNSWAELRSWFEGTFNEKKSVSMDSILCLLYLVLRLNPDRCDAVVFSLGISFFARLEAQVYLLFDVGRCGEAEKLVDVYCLNCRYLGQDSSRLLIMEPESANITFMMPDKIGRTNTVPSSIQAAAERIRLKELFPKTHASKEPSRLAQITGAFGSSQVESDHNLAEMLSSDSVYEAAPTDPIQARESQTASSPSLSPSKRKRKQVSDRPLWTSPRKKGRSEAS